MYKSTAKGILTAAILFSAVSLQAQSLLPSAPKPAGVVRHLSVRILLPDLRTRADWWLVSTQAANATFDGVTTTLFIRRPNVVEQDPLCRLLMGPKPTWSRMAPLGYAEVWATSRLPRTWHHVPVRIIAQLGLSAWHGSEGIRNAVLLSEPAPPTRGLRPLGVF